MAARLARARHPVCVAWARVTGIDRWVHFRIRDVYYPDPQKVLAELHGDDLLQGRVVDVTDNRGSEGTFAVVKVEGIETPIVVPLNRILGAL
jgi:hypothetical protein